MQNNVDLICKLIRKLICKQKLLLFNNIKKNKKKKKKNTSVLKSLVRDFVEVVIIWESWTKFFLVGGCDLYR